MERNSNGFTLVEVVIVVAILSFLLVSAVPLYLEQVRKTYRALAMAELQKVVLKQEQFFSEHHVYAEGLAKLGFPGDAYILARDGNARSFAGGQGIYSVSLEHSEGTYTVRATPLRFDPRCGTLGLDGLGIRAATGRDGVSGCW